MKIIDTIKKLELEKRNNQIMNAIISKMKRDCPGCVDLIGISGSFYTGDIHEKSDLDLLIIINDDKANIISSCFILDGVGFDIYCSKWDRLEHMAEFKDPYSGKLIDLKIVYTLDKKVEERYYQLQSKLMDKLNSPLSKLDIEKAKDYLRKAECEYINVMTNDDMALCRYSSALFLNHLEFSLYMLNKKFVKHGIKRIPQEIENMHILPEKFLKLHNNIVCAESVSNIKTSCTEILKIMKKCFKDFEDNGKERKEITADDLVGTYEEIYSNWYSKMFHSIEINSPYLSFQTLSSCQNFYNMMSENFSIDNINIIDKFSHSDLNAATDYFSKGMEEYLKLYKKHNVNVKNYQTIENFEKDYLA